MEKIKSVLSHGGNKDRDSAQGRHDTPTAAEFDRSNVGGSHVGDTRPQGTVAEAQKHPIYDQFAKGNTTGESIQATDHAPHFSNTPNVSQTTSSNAGAPTAPSATASLHPNQYRPSPHEDMSTASIKSGVIGFPQGSDGTHAARPSNNPHEQNQRGGDQTSYAGQNAAFGAAGSGLGRAPQTNLQRQESDIPESGRSFPLAGGIAQQTPVTTTTTNEREPGTKEREAGLRDGEGREGLTGAAAATTTASSMPEHDEPIVATSQSQTTRSANPAALAAATTATSAAYGWGNHEHEGHGHKFEGARLQSPEEPKSDLLFTSGPHVTDTANRTDPHLHIPGEFPSPTPVEESDASSYLQSKPTAETNPSAFTEPELRHTGSLDQPQPRSSDPASQHHFGRDAAIAGGVGAAGAGVYAAGKHHQKEDTPIGQEIFPDEPNPYSSKQMDPRVDTAPRGGFGEQRYDPTASENRSPRNAVLTGGAIGSSQPSTSQSPSGPELKNKEYPAASQDVKSDPQHHYGRDAALVGAGAATTAGLYASQRENEPDSGPASSTIGPHKSNVANVVDPRVQPNPDLQKHHYAAPTVEDPAPSTVGPHKSDVANIVDPRVLPDAQKQKAAPKEGQLNQPEQHHYGRDAAVVGGTGAAGYGAYEAVKMYGEHPSTQPAASMNDQRYDPSAPGAHEPKLAGSQPTQVQSQGQQHHYGRDAALAGGLGAAGAGAYAATNRHGEEQYPVTGAQNLAEQRYDPSTSAQGQQPVAYQPYSQPDSAVHQRYDSTQVPEEDHTKRNAALGTVAGAGALGAGAYGLSQHDAQKEQERQLKEQQKAFDHQQKTLDKQQAHDQKHHDKLVAAEEKKHAKEAEHKEREHAKELERKQREHDEKLAAARADQERRSQDPEEGTPEKKHRILTFLNKKDNDHSGSGENSPRQSRESPRHSREYPAGAASYEHEEGRLLGEKKGRHVLHKDPPKGHPARESLEHSSGSLGKREHIGTDGPIGDPNMISGDQQIRSGVYGAHPATDATGGHHTVTEQHTGLPMNVERYGDGRGGIDGSQTIHGQHDGGHRTDWEGVRKNDTLY